MRLGQRGVGVKEAAVETRTAVSYKGIVFVGSGYFRNVDFLEKRSIICGMGTGFLSRILPGCQHQFAWPRRDESGGYYQLCVACGMQVRIRLDQDVSHSKSFQRRSHQRLRRNGEPERAQSVMEAARTTSSLSRSGCRKSLRKRGMAARYLEENISRSGLLFTCTMRLEEGQTLELKLEMPKDLTGDTAAPVLCQGKIARVTEVPATGKTEQSFVVACSIEDYELASKPPSRAAVRR